MNRWKEFVSNLKDPSGTGGKPMRVTAEMLREHSKPDNLWILLDDRVYNANQFLRFHPGGSQPLMKAVGKDAKPMLQCHVWVDCHSVLERCFVGYFVDQKDSHDETGEEKGSLAS